MLREEMLVHLNALKHITDDSSMMWLALDMAIKELEQAPCEDCRNCKKWNECPCGKEGHENRTSIGYSIGECNNYEPCEDCVSRQAVDTLVDELARAISDERCCISRGRSTATIMQDILDLPPVTPQPKTGHCKDCKWWKDSDGAYRRGIGAESQCPINRKEVCEGNGYCFLFEPQGSEVEE